MNGLPGKFWPGLVLTHMYLLLFSTDLSIIQASDVAHCMQDWGIYQKYNRRLFEEQLQAFRKGYTGDDPRPGWYKGEIWFFENYISKFSESLPWLSFFHQMQHNSMFNALLALFCISSLGAKALRLWLFWGIRLPVLAER